MKNTLFSKRTFAALSSLALVLSLLAVAVSPAFAMSTDPTSVVTRGPSDAKSEAMFHHALTVYNATLKSSLYENNSNAAALQYIRSRENGASGGSGRGYGKFSPSQFAALYGNFFRVNSLMLLIKSMLDAHPGFDRYGQVTNSMLAADTAKDINAYAISLQYYTAKAVSLYSMLQHTR